MLLSGIFVCSECPDTFQNISTLCKHFRYKHIGLSQKFYCPYEGCVLQAYCNRSSFTNHINRQHAEKEPKSPIIDVIRVPDVHSTVRSNIEDSTEINQSNNNIVVGTSENLEISAQEIPQSSNLLLKCFKESILKLALNVYSNPKLPVSGAETIISDVQALVVNPIVELFQEIHTNFSEKIVDIKKELPKYSSEAKLSKILSDKGLYKKPKKEILNEYSAEVLKKGKAVIGTIKELAVISDVEFQLKSFLEIPGIYNIISDYSASEKESTQFSSYINCEHWAKKEEEDKEVLALDLYYDDFEVNNPLGSNTGTNTLCGFYFSLPHLPPYLRGRLNNIFLALLVEVKILNVEENLEVCSIILNKIFNSISKNGIKIQVNGQERIVYFKIGLHKGDNLALNKTLGFSPSFSANYFCRFCKIHKKTAWRKCDLNGVQFRNEQNYEQDLQHDFKTTGIAFRSRFVDLKNFHPVDNPFVDKMHDFDEGVVIYMLEIILFYFIVTKKYFTIERLNYIKKFFNYGEIQVGNKSGPLKFIRKKCKGKFTKMIKLKSSASETLCFLKLLPLMINKLVPKRDKVWHLLIKLVKLSDLLDLPEYSEQSLIRLKKAIEDHHSTFLKLFPKEHLRPKFHHLLHYPDLIRKMGPPKSNNCYIFEQKHKLLKTIAKSTTSRKCLPLTVSKKISLDNAKRFFQKLNPKELEYSNLKRSNKMNQRKNLESFKDPLENNNFDLINVEFFDKVSFRDQLYKPGFYIFKNSKFFKIYSIFMYFDKFFLIIVEISTMYSLNTTFHIIRNETNRTEIMEMNMLRSFPVNCHFINNTYYIKNKLF